VEGALSTSRALMLLDDRLVDRTNLGRGSSLAGESSAITKRRLIVVDRILGPRGNKTPGFSLDTWTLREFGRTEIYTPVLSI
jgi:hypothetical protein